MLMPEQQIIKHESEKVSLGFWIYLMTDAVLFASLFAAFAVLRNSINGGSTLGEIINPPYVLTQTIVLLTSSFTCSIAISSMGRKSVKAVTAWLSATFILGATFLGMELYEFRKLVVDGNSWRSSAALSSFFTLVGTHGLHIMIGLLWALLLLWAVRKKGLTQHTQQKLRLFSMYWHFLDVIWICVFTVVYLRGIM
jgi:cytochrome o ubiquinol oxidase subunit 3